MAAGSRAREQHRRTEARPGTVPKETLPGGGGVKTVGRSSPSPPDGADNMKKLGRKPFQKQELKL